MTPFIFGLLRPPSQSMTTVMHAWTESKTWPWTTYYLRIFCFVLQILYYYLLDRYLEWIVKYTALVLVIRTLKQPIIISCQYLLSPGVLCYTLIHVQVCKSNNVHITIFYVTLCELSLIILALNTWYHFINCLHVATSLNNESFDSM